MSSIKISIGAVIFNNPREELSRFSNSVIVAIRNARRVFPKLQVELLIKNNGKTLNLKNTFPYAKLLHNKKNNGYASAMSEIIETSFLKNSSDYHIAVNPDGAFHPLCILELLRMSKRFPHDLIEATQFPCEHPKKYNPKNYLTKWASGCCILITKELFQSVGNFDPNFFMYMEDVDYSWRVLQAKKHVRISPAAKYFHPVSGRITSITSRQYYFESGRYLGYKWNNRQFKDWCEDQLILNKYYKNKRSMPSLPKIEKHHHSINTSNFKYKFLFSESRW